MHSHTWTDTEILEALISNEDIGPLMKYPDGWYYDGHRYPSARAALEVLANRIINRSSSSYASELEKTSVSASL